MTWGIFIAGLIGFVFGVLFCIVIFAISVSAYGAGRREGMRADENVVDSPKE